MQQKPIGPWKRVKSNTDDGADTDGLDDDDLDGHLVEMPLNSGTREHQH